jgi:hypothetical protein
MGELFVTGLSWEVTPDELRGQFKKEFGSDVVAGIFIHHFQFPAPNGITDLPVPSGIGRITFTSSKDVGSLCNEWRRKHPNLRYSLSRDRPNVKPLWYSSVMVTGLSDDLSVDEIRIPFRNYQIESVYKPGGAAAAFVRFPSRNYQQRVLREFPQRKVKIPGGQYATISDVVLTSPTFSSLRENVQQVKPARANEVLRDEIRVMHWFRLPHPLLYWTVVVILALCRARLSTWLVWMGACWTPTTNWADGGLPNFLWGAVAVGLIALRPPTFSGALPMLGLICLCLLSYRLLTSGLAARKKAAAAVALAVVLGVFFTVSQVVFLFTSIGCVSFVMAVRSIWPAAFGEWRLDKVVTAELAHPLVVVVILGVMSISYTFDKLPSDDWFRGIVVSLSGFALGGIFAREAEPFDWFGRLLHQFPSGESLLWLFLVGVGAVSGAVGWCIAPDSLPTLAAFRQIVGWVTGRCCIVPIGIVFLRAGFRFGIVALVVVVALFASGALTTVVCAADGAVVVIVLRSLWELAQGKRAAAVTPRVRGVKKWLVENAFRVAKEDANRVVGLPPDKETRFLLSRAEDVAWKSIARRFWEKWNGAKIVSIAVAAVGAIVAFWWLMLHDLIDRLAEENTMQSIS